MTLANVKGLNWLRIAREWQGVDRWSYCLSLPTLQRFPYVIQALLSRLNTPVPVSRPLQWIHSKEYLITSST